MTNYKVGCIYYKRITGTAPSYLTELLPKYKHFVKLRSASDTRHFQGGNYKRKTHGYRSVAHISGRPSPTTLDTQSHFRHSNPN